MTASHDHPVETDRLSAWVDVVHEAYPPRDAAGWDEVGLHVGAPDDPVSGVLVSLDVTEDVIDEALEAGANLVLAHHPLLFRPLSRLTPETAAGRLALYAARSRCAILAAHTNFDVAAGGTSDPVARLLGLQDVRALQPLPPPGSVKLVTFVPADATEAVLTALSAAGAGRIGEYSTCSFRVAGTGTFRPSDAATPAIGQRGQLNQVPEDRIEMVVEQDRIPDVVMALNAAHPYEEVAYDLVPLVDGESRTSDKGLGRAGTLPRPQPLAAVARTIARDLPSPHLRVSGDPDRLVSRVAVCGGAGDALIDAARAVGADVYVTADLRHHPTLDARTQGLALIDAGHYWTEAAALPAMRDRLAQVAARHGLRARLVASTVVTDPWVDPVRWQIRR